MTPFPEGGDFPTDVWDRDEALRFWSHENDSVDEDMWDLFTEFLIEDKPRQTSDYFCPVCDAPDCHPDKCLNQMELPF